MIEQFASYCKSKFLLHFLQCPISATHNDPPLYKSLVKVISDHLHCIPGIPPDIKDFKFPAMHDLCVVPPFQIELECHTRVDC